MKSNSERIKNSFKLLNTSIKNDIKRLRQNYRSNWKLLFKEYSSKRKGDLLSEVNEAYEFLDNISDEVLEEFIKEFFNDNNSIKKEEKKIKTNYKEQKNRIIIKENKEFLKNLLREAEKVFLINDYLNAQKLYTRVVESPEFKYFSPINEKLKIFTQRGISFLKLKQFDKAINDFNSAIKIDSGSSIAYFNRGICNLRKEHWLNAIIDFNKAIVFKKSSDPEYYYFRGLAKNGFQEYEDALKDFETAIDMNSFKKSYIDAKNFTLRKISANKKKNVLKAKSIEKNQISNEDKTKLNSEKKSQGEILKRKEIEAKVVSKVIPAKKVLDRKKKKKELEQEEVDNFIYSFFCIILAGVFFILFKNIWGFLAAIVFVLFSASFDYKAAYWLITLFFLATNTLLGIFFIFFGFFIYFLSI